MTAKIRLACAYCDRNDLDGIAGIPPDWKSVSFVQTYAQSINIVNCASILDWYTHVGTCPDCLYRLRKQDQLRKDEP